MPKELSQMTRNKTNGHQKNRPLIEKEIKIVLKCKKDAQTHREHTFYLSDWQISKSRRYSYVGKSRGTLSNLVLVGIGARDSANTGFHAHPF